jgi:hypothetical protein
MLEVEMTPLLLAALHHHFNLRVLFLLVVVEVVEMVPELLLREQVVVLVVEPQAILHPQGEVEIHHQHLLLREVMAGLHRHLLPNMGAVVEAAHLP